MERTAIYLRVSKDKQTTDNQRLQLEALAAARVWDVVEIYIDHGITGSVGSEGRPALDKMMKDATRGRFDRVLCWAVDRLGRSMNQVCQVMTDLDTLGIKQFFHLQGMDTSTITGRAMVQMAAVFAEMERAMIVERVNAGLSRAKAQGKQLGRAGWLSRPGVISNEMRDHIRALAEKNPNASIRSIAAEVKVSVGSVHKILSDNQQRAI